MISAKRAKRVFRELVKKIGRPCVCPRVCRNKAFAINILLSCPYLIYSTTNSPLLARIYVLLEPKVNYHSRFRDAMKRINPRPI